MKPQDAIQLSCFVSTIGRWRLNGNRSPLLLFCIIAIPRPDVLLCRSITFSALSGVAHFQLRRIEFNELALYASTQTLLMKLAPRNQIPRNSTVIAADAGIYS